MAQLINVLGILLVIIVVVWPAAKIVRQWERGIVLRFGRYVGTRSPGLNIIIPLH